MVHALWNTRALVRFQRHFMMLDLNWTIKATTHNRVLVATIFLPKPCPLKMVGKIFVFLAVRAVLSHFSDEAWKWPDRRTPYTSEHLWVWPCTCDLIRTYREANKPIWSAPSCYIALAGAFAQIGKSAYQLRHVCPSVYLCAVISAAPTGRVFVKFDIGDFCENMSKNSRFR